MSKELNGDPNPDFPASKYESFHISLNFKVIDVMISRLPNDKAMSGASLKLMLRRSTVD